TVSYVSQCGAKVVIAADQHLDKARLTQLLGREVRRLDQWGGQAGQRAVVELPEGGIAFIDDLALDPRERLADDGFAHELAELCDIYCNDAFSISHETRASTVITARTAKLAVAGFAFAREFNLLEILLGHAKEPTLAVLGGELS